MSTNRLVEIMALSVALGLVIALSVACQRQGEEAGGRGPDFGAVGGDTSLRDPDNDGRRCPRDEAYLEESLDTSGDNVADVRKIYRVEGEGSEAQKIIVCRELDLDHDGRKDIFRFFNDEGRPQRELIDADFDGTIDSISFFEAGRLIKQEADRNEDGQADETRHFVHGKLMRVDRDDNHDGQIDVWEHWDQGDLVRIGYDVNRDKVADFWHRAPPREGEDEDEEEEAEEEPAGDDEAEETSSDDSAEEGE